jgi:signal peptidase I
MSTFDFPLLLTSLVFLTGIIWLTDILFFKKRRLQANPKAVEPKIVEYAHAFFPVLLLVLVVRSFIVQPYRVPTGSLEPTILPGDFVAVNQFAYGLRLPVLNTKIFSIGEPKIGEIAIFRWPVNPKVDFIKRVVGTPGDHVVYQNKVLYINGKMAKLTPKGDAIDYEPEGDLNVQRYTEDLAGVKHDILINPEGGETGDFDITVPKGYYFMMGDNRDDSADSREWGFVPEENLIGKGFLIWMNWDSETHRIHWHRIGTVI